MTARLIPAAVALTTLAAASPAGACGWWGESVGEKPPESITTNESDLAKLDISTPEGMVWMAHAHRLGQGVPQDDLVARRWMTRAAHAGDAGAMNDLEQMFETGIAQAQHSLALMLFEGLSEDALAALAEQAAAIVETSGQKGQS